MSCEIQLIATFEGLNKFLDNEEEAHVENKEILSKNTILDFHVGISPTGEIIVFGKSSWLMVCASKWNPAVSEGIRIQYTPKWHGHINSNKQGDTITSIMCLPFFSDGPSCPVCPDWTCIVVGFTSGCIRFFTEGLHELAWSVLHEEPVTDIKCHSSLSAQQQGNTEIHVLYKTVICIANGYALSQMLKNRKQEAADGKDFNSEDDNNGYCITDFKKFSFVKQETITDACFLGQALVSSYNTYDHLAIKTLVEGFKSDCKANPPQTSLVVATGRRPFVGFHYTSENAMTSLFTDVALAVASKVKNSVAASLPGWFGFGTKKAEKPPEKPKEINLDAEQLSCRFGLHDIRRKGDSIKVTPDGVFSAVTDSLGRVLLVDNITGIAFRMWKGYRDAQCGFMEVPEETAKEQHDRLLRPITKKGLFIIIYAPKKGVIEIFAIQHRHRIASFKVTKYGRLIYNPRGRVGSNSRTSIVQNQVIFLSDEGIREFYIPFHCSLARESCKKSRDLQIYKTLKGLLKTNADQGSVKFVEKVEKHAKGIKTDVVIYQAIELFLNDKNVSLEAFKCVINIFLDHLQNTERQDPPPQKTVLLAQEIYYLLLFYEFLIDSAECPPNYDTLMEPEELGSLSEKLRLSKGEFNYVLQILEQIKVIEKKKKLAAKVDAPKKKESRLGQFLSCFDFEHYLKKLEKNEKTYGKRNTEKHFLSFRPNSKDDSLTYLGEVFFKSVFNSISILDVWKSHAMDCSLNPLDLALSLLSYWCSKNVMMEFPNEVFFMVDILKVVCHLNDPKVVVSVEYNAESPWWLKLRTFIASSPFTMQALFAALCCRSITLCMEEEREAANKNTSDSGHCTKAHEGDTCVLGSGWERLSKDTCQWDILITQLQDVALLNVILNVTNQEDSFFCLTKIPFEFEGQCLTSIQSGGSGRVSELVAKWLLQFELDPETLIDESDFEFHCGASSKEKFDDKYKQGLLRTAENAKEVVTDDEKDMKTLALEYLVLLKKRFPYSLTTSSILGNVCWEYTAYWYKKKDDVDYLELALSYLESIPSGGVKYGICYLSWIAYLEQRFKNLAKMINMLGKIPSNTLCLQEIGLRSDHIQRFLKVITEYLKLMLETETEDTQNFETNREVIWENAATCAGSSLISIALSQPIVNLELILFLNQLSYSLLLICGLNIKLPKILSCLFDIEKLSDFELAKNFHPNINTNNPSLINSRKQFLKKAISASVLTVELVECVQPSASNMSCEVPPCTRYFVDDYKSWLQVCFSLASSWGISLEEIQRHLVCELYSNGLDRLAEEVIPSINESGVLASQLLVLAGKRLKCLIQDSGLSSEKFTKMSVTLNDWLGTLDLENFKYQCGSLDDIEVIMRYVWKCLPERHYDQKLVLAVLDTLAYLKENQS